MSSERIFKKRPKERPAKALARVTGLVLASILAVSGLSGCKAAGGWGKDAEGKVKVMTTIYPMYDFAKRIGGEFVSVEMMVPAGTEPHAWEPSSKDMLKLESADLFIYNGAGMELWVEDLIKGVQNKDLVVLEASENVELIRLDEDHEDEDHDDHGHHHGEFDPHVWLSPLNAAIEMESIAAALSKIDPDHASEYSKNLEEARALCQELDNEMRDGLSGFDSKYLVVAHEAYGYLCQEYGLTQIGIEGVSAESEPDAARMREIIDLVNEYGIKCIFFEELVSPKVAETIAKETGCETQSLSPLDGLSQEEMDAGSDYFSVQKENLAAIIAALEGENNG